MYTQCPSCRTMFRISELQLAAAKGKVRCGKCNHIYNAQGTLIDELPQQSTATAKPVVAAPVAEEKDNLDIGALTEVPADINIAPPETPVSNDWQDDSLATGTSQTSFTEEEDDDDWLFGDDDETDIPSINHLDKIDDDDIQMVNLGSDSNFSSDFDDDEDDDWLFDDDNGLPEAEDEDTGVDIVLRNEGDDIPEEVMQTEQVKATELQPGDDNEEQDSDFMRHMSDYLDDDKADELISDESAVGILDEVNEQLSFAIENTEAEEAKDTQGINLPNDWFDDDDDFDQAIKASGDEEQEKLELNDAILKNVEPAPSEAGEPGEPEQQPATPELSTEPFPDNPFASNESIVLQADAEPDIGHKIGQHDEVPLRIRDSIGIKAVEPRTGLKWLGVIGSIVALVFILVAQLVLFRSADLANQYPDLQPTLTSLCETLPCRDSRRHDIHEIELMSRNISQHPKSKSALLIKAAIINRANFAQRYPKIQISLSDVTGETVAQRIFYPQEYLGSLYDPFLQMKPNTPVHIALEVMDPGSAAINFEFKFL